LGGWARVSIFIKAERCITHAKSLKTRLIPLLISSLPVAPPRARKPYLSSVRSRTFPDAGVSFSHIGGRSGVEGKPLPGIVKGFRHRSRRVLTDVSIRRGGFDDIEKFSLFNIVVKFPYFSQPQETFCIFAPRRSFATR